MGSRRTIPGAWHLKSFAVFLVVTGLLLLAVATPCPHRADTSDGDRPVASSTAAPVQGAGAATSCAGIRDHPSTVTRTVGDGPRLTGDCNGGVGDAQPGDQGAPAAGRAFTATIGPASLPHGWALLLLLEIARE